MPHLTPCAEPGCPTLTTATRCPTHHRAHRRAADQRRPNANQRGYDSRWQRRRKAHLRRHPTCQCTYAEHHPNGCNSQATDVDHIHGRGRTGGEATHDLQALCHDCHSWKTAHFDGAFGRPRRPANDPTRRPHPTTRTGEGYHP